MKTLLRFLPWLLLSLTVAEAGPTFREETVFLFENRKLAIAVPTGFGYHNNKDEHGLMNVQLAAPKDKVTLHVVFVPDPEGTFVNARARKEKMVDLFQEYVGDSVEKAMQFEELEPRMGAGTYCVFTDATLAAKAKCPPGEYLHLTTGVKAWPGVVAVFRLASNDTKSSEYQAAMKTLRESLDEKPVPLK